jgi:excinuclease UvrABC helicase subunit UvrB
VRVKCPIYIDEAVVDEAGISVKMVEEKNRELKASDVRGEVSDEPETPQPVEAPSLTPDSSEVSALKKLLDSAIEEENYEEAARLRDRIRELEST